MTFECGYCTALFADPDGLYAHASASHGLAALELDRLTQQAFNIYSRLRDLSSASRHADRLIGHALARYIRRERALKQLLGIRRS